MKTGLAVADAMTTKPVTVPSSLTVRDASKIMRDHGIGSLLIVNDGVLVGIIISDDIVHRVTAEAKPSAETKVQDIMTKEIVDIAPEADLYDAMTLMKEHDIMHLPVRDKHKRLLGFLTFKDVMRMEPALFELMGDLAEISQSNNPLSHSATTEGYCEICGNFSSLLLPKAGKMMCSYCKGDTE
jgi:CBS domain-containing protein